MTVKMIKDIYSVERNARRARVVVALLATIACASCLTPYQPRPSPRVQVMDAVGVRTFAKDGRVITDGPLGGGLYDLVKDNPRAADDATAHRIDIAISVVLGAASLAAGGVGAALLVSQQPDLAVPGIAALSGGVLGLIPATVLQLTADTHMWRAINVYNDDLEAPASALTDP